MPTDAGGLTERSNNRPASTLYMTMSTVEQRTVGRDGKALRAVLTSTLASAIFLKY